MISVLSNENICYYNSKSLNGFTAADHLVLLPLINMICNYRAYKNSEISITILEEMQAYNKYIDWMETDQM